MQKHFNLIPIMRQNIAIITFIIWLFTILAIFYVVQKPFQPATALALSQIGLDLLTTLWLISVSTALGQRLLGRLPLSTGENLILGSGLGLGLLGLLTFGLGLIGLFYSWFFIGLTLFLTLLLQKELRTLIKTLLAWRPAPPPRLATAYMVALGGLTLILALLPPTDWDGLLYHLTAPKLFIEQHRIVSGIDSHPFYYPFLIEMIFSYSILLRGGDIVAKLLHFSYGILLTALVYLTTTHHLKRPAGWSAILIFLSMPLISTLATWAYNDLALAFYQLAILYTFIKSETSPQRQGWLILTGCMAGFALGIKYTSFISPLLIGVILLYRLSRAISYASLRSLAHFCLPAVAIGSPWYIKNYFFTGNPVYPFIFGGLFWDEFRNIWYQQAGTGIGADIITLLNLPFLVTLGIRDVNYYDGRIGPLILLFLPLLLLYALLGYRRQEQPSGMAILILFAFAHTVFWTLGIMGTKHLWQARLLLPALATLAPVIGWIWQDLAHLNQPRFSLQRFLNLLIGFVLVMNLTQLALQVIALRPLPYLTGLESRQEYLSRQLGAHYLAMEKLNQIVPAEAVVLFLWEPRTYYCQVTCLPDTILDRLAHDYYKHPNAKAIAQAWRAEGITHVLLFRGGLDFIQAGQSEPLSAEAVHELSLIEQNDLTKLVDIGGMYEIYKVK